MTASLTALPLPALPLLFVLAVAVAILLGLAMLAAVVHVVEAAMTVRERDHAERAALVDR